MTTRGKKTLMLDLWGTLICCPHSAQKVSKLIRILSKYSLYREDEIFKDWKNMWYKQNISALKFATYLSNKYNLSDSSKRAVEALIPYSLNEIQIYSDVIPALDIYKNKGYNLVAVSDCGPDTKKNITKLGLDRYFAHMFFSFEEGTTKNENLYDKVISKLKSAPNSLTMIGNDYERDYSVPRAKGINAMLLDRDEKYHVKPLIRTLADSIKLVENGK